MIKVLSKRLVQFGKGASPYSAELVCDDVGELPKPDHYGDWIIDMGSIAHVINTGDTYRLNSDGEWKLQKKLNPTEKQAVFLLRKPTKQSLIP